MSRRAARPLSRQATQAANDAFYAAHPELVHNGRRVPLDPRGDLTLRTEWMDLYVKHGGEVEGSPQGGSSFFDCVERCPAPVSHEEPQANNAPAIEQNNTIQACPVRLSQDDPPPAGWQDYHGNSAVFHCGYRGILENVKPSPGRLQNECFYDETGRLVDEGHPYSECGGSPNEYDSDDDPWNHTFNDEGGIYERGWDAFWGSRRHDADEASDWTEQKWDEASDWTEQKWNEASDWTEQKWNEASDWTEQKWNEASDWAEQKMDEASDWAEQKMDDASEWTEQQWNEASEWVDQQWNDFADEVGEQWDKLRSW